MKAIPFSYLSNQSVSWWARNHEHTRTSCWFRRSKWYPHAYGTSCAVSSVDKSIKMVHPFFVLFRSYKSALLAIARSHPLSQRAPNYAKASFQSRVSVINRNCNHIYIDYYYYYYVIRSHSIHLWHGWNRQISSAEKEAGAREWDSERWVREKESILHVTRFHRPSVRDTQLHAHPTDAHTDTRTRARARILAESVSFTDLSTNWIHTLKSNNRTVHLCTRVTREIRFSQPRPSLTFTDKVDTFSIYRYSYYFYLRPMHKIHLMLTLAKR